MTVNQPNIPFQGAGQAPNPSENPEAGKGGTPEVPVTRAEFEQLMSSMITREEAEKIAESKAQSFADKTGQRFEKRVSEIETSLKSTLEASGKAIPEDWNLRQMAIDQAIKEGATQPSTVTPPGQPSGLDQPGGENGSDPVSAWAQSRVASLQMKHGVEIIETDPEWKDIKDTGTIDDYLDSYEAAILAKAARTSTPPPSGRSPAEIPTGSVGNNAIADNNDPADLIRIWREKREAG